MVFVEVPFVFPTIIDYSEIIHHMSRQKANPFVGLYHNEIMWAVFDILRNAALYSGCTVEAFLQRLAMGGSVHCIKTVPFIWR